MYDHRAFSCVAKPNNRQGFSTSDGDNLEASDLLRNVGVIDERSHRAKKVLAIAFMTCYFVTLTLELGFEFVGNKTKQTFPVAFGCRRHPYFTPSIPCPVKLRRPMASDILHIKDSFYFEVPKALSGKGLISPLKSFMMPMVLWVIRNHEGYQEWEAKQIIEELKPLVKDPKKLDGAIDQWKHWQHEKHARRRSPVRSVFGR